MCAYGGMCYMWLIVVFVYTVCGYICMYAHACIPFPWEASLALPRPAYMGAIAFFCLPQSHNPLATVTLGQAGTLGLEHY